jgi:hypothetical protein
MRTAALSQIAGKDTVAETLNGLLADTQYNRLRYLLAYVRWSGLHLIDTELQRFALRGSLDGIVSIDFGGSTVEALTYLSELPHSKLRIFQSGASDIGFHPKVFILDGRKGWATVVGSANGSTGGFFNNIEICAVITGTSRERNPFDEVWRQLATPLAPVSKSNLISVTPDVLQELAPKLDDYTKAAPDRPKNIRFRNPPSVARTARAPHPGRPPAPTKPPPRARKKAAPTTTTARAPRVGPKTLYVELWDETGGGTQVQFPKTAITDYFGSDLKSITWLRLSTPDGTEKVRIQTFPNNTFRIPLPFTAPVRRRAVLRFERLGQDRYRVQALDHRHRSYHAWLRRCTERTRSDSKGYGIH